MMDRTVRIVACVAGLWASVAAGQEKASLRPRFEPGAYLLAHVQELESGVAAPGAPLSGTRSRVEFDVRLRAEAPRDGRQAMEAEFLRVRQSLREGNATTAYDSDKPDAAENAGQPLLRALARAKIGFALGADGTVGGVSGADALWDRLRKLDAKVQPARAEDLQDLADFLIREIILNGHDLLPARELAAGGTWKASRPAIPGQKQPIELTCRLTSLAGGRAQVDGSGEGVVKGQPDIRVKASARLVIDLKTGLLEKALLDNQTTSTFPPSKDEKDAQPVELQGLTRAESTWKREEKKELQPQRQ